MEKTQILVLPRYVIETVGTSDKMVVISITDPNQRNAKILGTPKDLLELKFYDTLSDTGISDEDAQKISKFVKKYWGKIITIVVQCEMGISRSAGVAAAISKWYNNDDTMYFDNQDYRPNIRCYRKVLNALSKDINKYFKFEE